MSQRKNMAILRQHKHAGTQVQTTYLNETRAPREMQARECEESALNSFYAQKSWYSGKVEGHHEVEVRADKSSTQEWRWERLCHLQSQAAERRVAYEGT